MTDKDIELLLEALDSHVYWQLSDPEFRHDAAVLAPGSNDIEKAKQIHQAKRLATKLEGLL